jgi:hypothetical protein
MSHVFYWVAKALPYCNKWNAQNTCLNKNRNDNRTRPKFNYICQAKKSDINTPHYGT